MNLSVFAGDLACNREIVHSSARNASNRANIFVNWLECVEFGSISVKLEPIRAEIARNLYLKHRYTEIAYFLVKKVAKKRALRAYYLNERKLHRRFSLLVLVWNW